MGSASHQEFADLATELIDEDGQECVFVSMKNQDNDLPNDKPWRNTKDELEVKHLGINIAFLPGSTGSYFGRKVGSLRLSHVDALMAPQSFQPNKKDVVERGNTRLVIDDLDKIDVNGTVCLWLFKFVR